MELVPISSLIPHEEIPPNTAFKSLVTLLWPFSSANGQTALLLADPDSRKRYHRGQVRVRFAGASAKAIAASKVGIGDEIELALEGARWITEAEGDVVKTPGKGLEGELIFGQRLRLVVRSEGREDRALRVEESDAVASSSLAHGAAAAAGTPRTPAPANRPVRRSLLGMDDFGVAIYSSPAFMKRLRLSEGAYAQSPYTPNSDDEGELDAEVSRKRRRVSYKNVSEWKYDGRESSSEKEDAEQGVARASDGRQAEEAGWTEASVDVSEDQVAALAQDEDSVMKDASPRRTIESVQQIAVELGEKQHSEEASQTESSQPKVPSMPPPSLPRLEMPTAPSQVTASSPVGPGGEATRDDSQDPSTPRLHPVDNQGLPLPSPFPTSAEKLFPSVPEELVKSATTEGTDTRAKSDETVESEGDALHTRAIDNGEPNIVPQDFKQDHEHLEKPSGTADPMDFVHSSPSHGPEAVVPGNLRSQFPQDVETATNHPQAVEQVRSLTPGSEADMSSEDGYDEEALADLQDSHLSEEEGEPDFDILAGDLRKEIDEQDLMDMQEQNPDSHQSEDDTTEDEDDDEKEEMPDHENDLEDLDESLLERSDDDTGNEDEYNHPVGFESAVLPAAWGQQEYEPSDRQTDFESFATQIAAGPLTEQLLHPYGLDGSGASRTVEAYDTRSVPLLARAISPEASPAAVDEEDAWKARDDAIRVLGGHQPEAPFHAALEPASLSFEQEMMDAPSQQSKSVIVEPSSSEEEDDNEDNEDVMDVDRGAKENGETDGTDARGAEGHTQAGLSGADVLEVANLEAEKSDVPEASVDDEDKQETNEIPMSTTIAKNAADLKDDAVDSQHETIRDNPTARVKETTTDAPEPAPPVVVSEVSSPKSYVELQRRPSPAITDEERPDEEQAYTAAHEDSVEVAAARTSSADQDTFDHGETPSRPTAISPDQSRADSKYSVEVGYDALDLPQPAILDIVAPVPTPASESAVQDVDDAQRLTNSSFVTLSSSSPMHPQKMSLDTRSIEEIDLSQVEPDYSLSTSLSQRTALTGTQRTEPVPDSTGSPISTIHGSSRQTSRAATPPSGKTVETALEALQGSTVIAVQDFKPSQVDAQSLRPISRYGLRSQKAKEQATLPSAQVAQAEDEREVSVDEDLLAEFTQAAPEPKMDTDVEMQENVPFVQALGRGARRMSNTSYTKTPPPENEESITHAVVSKELTTPLVGEVSGEGVHVETLLAGEAESGVLASVLHDTKYTPKQNIGQVAGSKGDDEATLRESQVPNEKGRAPGWPHESEEHISRSVSPKNLELSTSQQSKDLDKSTLETTVEEKVNTTPRRSMRARMSGVPSVISAWFTPRRSSGLFTPIKEEPSASKPVKVPSTAPPKLLQQKPRGSAVSPSKLGRLASQGTTTSLSYFYPLAAIEEHLNQPASSVDIVAISVGESIAPTRATKGPKDFYTTLHIHDPSLHEQNESKKEKSTAKRGGDQNTLTKNVRVEVFRPWKASLPTTEAGDVILLRNFVVKSRNRQVYLLSSQASSWCVWRFAASTSQEQEYDPADIFKPVWARRRRVSIKEEVKGPPVDVGPEERQKAKELRRWWEGLQVSEGEQAEVDAADAKDDVKDDEMSGQSEA